MNTETLIRERLTTLMPVRLEIADDSAKHRGHAGAASGGGHFHVLIVSARFAGLNRLARHRLIYAALGDLMQQHIHALSIDAKADDEIEAIST